MLKNSTLADMDCVVGANPPEFVLEAAFEIVPGEGRSREPEGGHEDRACQDSANRRKEHGFSFPI